MLGRPEWFTYRLESWGIAPRTWQGWVYTGAFFALFFLVISLPIPQRAKSTLMWIIGGVFLLDVFTIWSQLGKVHDERQRLHQLIIERNCCVAAVIALAGALIYQSFRHQALDPLLLVVLGVMALTKLVTSLYVRWRL